MEKELDSTRTKHSKSEEENAVFRQRLPLLGAALEESKTECAKQRVAEEKLKKEKSDLQTQITSLSAQLDKLKNQLDRSEERNAEWSAKLKSAHDDSKMLEERLSDAEKNIKHWREQHK